MPHLSIRNLNKMVQAAKDWYKQDNTRDLVNNFDYLRLFEAAFKMQPNELFIAAPHLEACKYYDDAKNYVADNHLESINKSSISHADWFALRLKNMLQERFILILEDPVFGVINQIDQHIQQLRSPVNWFQRSAKDKIIALEELKGRLIEGAEGNIASVIIAWRDKNPTIARYLHNSEDEDKTGTMEFIDSLLDGEYALEYFKLTSDSQAGLSRENKQKLYQPFLNYLQSRTTWFQQLITFIFRKWSLSSKKLALAQEVIEDIQDSQESYAVLRERLELNKDEHAVLSGDHDKPHYNLREPRKEPVVRNEMYWRNDEFEWGYMGMPPTKADGHAIIVPTLVKDVRDGEDSNRSGLADAFHESLSIQM